MRTSSKIYVIDQTDAHAEKKRPQKHGVERTIYSPDAAPQRPVRPRMSRERAKDRADEKGSSALALLTYLLGPFAILATRRGRESKLWITLAALSCAGAGIVIARSNRIFGAQHGYGLGFLIWLSIACLSVLGGLAAWARGALFLGKQKGELLGRLPAALRHPGSAGALGFLVPGLGLYLSRHPRRAACALIAVAFAGVSALILWQASALWRLCRAGVLYGHGDTLERVFMAAGAAVVLGALAWLVQAFDGARLAGNRGDGPARAHGDWAAAALVIAVVALLASFKPARVAETIDRFAVSLRQDGLRLIPLRAAQASMRLDPSRPEYAVQAIEMNEALGRTDEALALRRDLAERWMPYERLLRLEARTAEGTFVGPEAPNSGD